MTKTMESSTRENPRFMPLNLSRNKGGVIIRLQVLGGAITKESGNYHVPADWVESSVLDIELYRVK